MVPQTISRYKITRELGRGAMGVVYQADDPNLGRTVALKSIQANTIGTNPREVAERFKNEARAVGGLSHPNIVTVFDAGEHDGLLYIAMELLEGETLEGHLAQRRTISVERAIDIVRQVCSALDYAHGKGIVHRDIKPANVMLSPNGTAKITDFGLARTAEAITLTGHVMGTPHYMAPEQVRGRPVDGRADLFSVGVMLYEMLTGERPFDGQSITTIMYKIVHEDPTPPRALDSSIPPGLSAVIERSLAKSPEDRYQTGAALVHALENHKSFQPSQRTAAETVAFTPATVNAPPSTQSISPPPPETATPPRRRYRNLAMTAGWILLGFISWLIFSHERNPKPAEPGTAQTQPRQTVMPPPAPVAPSAQTTSPAAEVVQKQPPESGKSTAPMNVSSNPPSAAIDLDGKPTGMQTPAQLQLTRGTHQVSVRMDGFVPASTKVNIKGGEQLEFSPQLKVQIPDIQVPQLDVQKLQSLQQKELRSTEFWQQWAKAVQQSAEGGAAVSDLSILVNTKPAGARILINGTDSGKTSPAIIPQRAGAYRVRVELDGYQAAEKEVKVGSARPAMVNLTLKPVGGNQQ